MKESTRFCVMAATLAIIGFSGVAIAEDETAAHAGEAVLVEDQFVRVAYNNEGFVIVGYRVANQSVKQEWMLLNVGVTVRKGVEPQTLTRDQFKVVTPDGTIVNLATEEEYQKGEGYIVRLEQANITQAEPIDYFPAGTNLPCSLTFFTDPTHPREGEARNQVELASTNACMGMLFFHIPGGIQYGEYNLDVHFENSIVKVPVKIMTKKEAQAFEKEWKQELKKERQEGHKKN